MKKNGFTLVEMLAVISVLLIIAVLSFSSFTKSIKNENQKSYESKIDNIVIAAKSYNNTNNGIIKQVSINDLRNYGYLANKIINPNNNQEMNGCVYIINNDYIYDEIQCTTLYDH